MSTHEFANLRAGGRALGAALLRVWQDDPSAVLAPVLPNGVPVALGIDDALTSLVGVLRWHPLAAERSDAGAVIHEAPGLAGCTVVVVDDGVETGTIARAAAGALRASGVARLVLAAPVCPREAEADLQRRYDQIVAVARPLARRDLSWHYADFDTIDEAEAGRLVAARGEG